MESTPPYLKDSRGRFLDSWGFVFLWLVYLARVGARSDLLLLTRAHAYNPARCTNSWNRGSPRRESRAGSVFKKVIFAERYLKASLRDSNA